MDREETLAQEEVVTDTTPNESQAQEVKTYTQEEVDNMMARMRGSLERKLLKPYEELGDPGELKALKEAEEKRRQEEQLKRGEFEKTLQELASKKDDEIKRRDVIIEDYKVNTPLLNAAAKFKSVNPEQVQSLLRNQVRLGESGEAEVLDSSGAVRYDDSGNPLKVEALVEEFLTKNPHFVAAAPSTTNTMNSVQPGKTAGDVDLKSLDLTNPQHRQLYKEAKRKGLLA
jgi:hypothetical protein